MHPYDGLHVLLYCNGRTDHASLQGDVMVDVSLGHNGRPLIRH